MSVIPDKLQKSVIIDIFRRIYSRWLFSADPQKEKGEIHMSMDSHLVQEYKKLISILVGKSMDIDYLIAVYSFASSYPDNTQKRDN